MLLSASLFCLSSITIPASVTSIGDNRAFSGCSSLRTVTVSRGTTIGRNAFPATARIIYWDLMLEKQKTAVYAMYFSNLL
jgi:hypothetical protein